MIEREYKYNLKIDKRLFEFINKEVLLGLDFKEDEFWMNFSDFIYKFSDQNKTLLNKRLDLKKKIDDWHLNNKGQEINIIQYEEFLKDIGYLIPEGENFSIETTNVDDEISKICGPQLVVPITNARYALNAANARWGSLYDALYGTDIMGTTANSSGYDEVRGKEVIKYAKNYLDIIFPLNNSKWEEINSVSVKNNLILMNNTSNSPVNLLNEEHFYGYKLNKNNQLNEIILEVHNLKVRIIINPEDKIGKNDPANIADIYFESAISTIMDCEDSVATVDGDDKVLAYKNWLGLN